MFEAIGIIISGILFYEIYCWLICYFIVNRNTSGIIYKRSLIPNRITLWHSVKFSMQKFNYYLHIITSLFYVALLYLGVGRRKPSHKDVVELILNTCLVLWCSVAPHNKKEGSIRVTLLLTGFEFLLLDHGHNNNLQVCFKVGPDETRVLKFELNGIKITTFSEQLNIIGIIISTVVHPIIHSFNNQLYEYQKDSEYIDFDDIFIHSQYLNWVSYSWSSLALGVSIQRGKEIFTFNSCLEIPKNHAYFLNELSSYSQLVSFLLLARPLFFRNCSKYGFKLDTEAFFICSILHAVDHYCCSKYLRGFYLSNIIFPNKGFYNFVVLFFYRPSQYYFFTNLLKAKHKQNSFYSSMYTDLCTINQELADIVTLSISY